MRPGLWPQRLEQRPRAAKTTTGIDVRIRDGHETAQPQARQAANVGDKRVSVLRCNPGLVRLGVDVHLNADVDGLPRRSAGGSKMLYAGVPRTPMSSRT